MIFLSCVVLLSWVEEWEDCIAQHSSSANIAVKSCFILYGSFVNDFPMVVLLDPVLAFLHPIGQAAAVVLLEIDHHHTGLFRVDEHADIRQIDLDPEFCAVRLLLLFHPCRVAHAAAGKSRE